MLVADFFVILQPIKVLLTQKVKNIMGGFFGTISTKDCVNDLFYGTDYNSHLGTKRAGLVTFDEESGFHRSIHSLERNYFRSRFEDELDEFKGHQGLGVISDTDPQPIIVNSHLGRYAVVTVAKINNLREIAEELLKQRMHFSEMSANNINQTELVALLINMGNSFVEGINKVYQKIEGSCSILILTEDGIIAARDFLGRTPIVIGKKEIHRLSPIGTDEFIQSVLRCCRNPSAVARYVHSSGFTMDSQPVTIRVLIQSMYARRMVACWVRKTTLRLMLSVVFPIRAWVWRWAIVKVRRYHTNVQS